MTDELIEFGFDECRDALAVLPECGVESLFGLVVEFAAPTEDGVLGDLWMIDTDAPSEVSGLEVPAVWIPY